MLTENNNFHRVEDRIIKADRIVLYGAGVIAYGIYQTLLEIYGIRALCYVVSDRAENEKELDGVEVIEINCLKMIKNTKLLILIATPEVYHEEIKTKLDNMNIQDYIAIDSYLEYGLMSKFLNESGFKSIEELPHIENSRDSIDIHSNFEMYMAKSHKDLKLKNEYDIPTWIIPVQAGKSLSKEKISALSDNTGIHISFKNGNYSELTVTYWAWKNRDIAYKGICHYRRILQMSPKEIEKIYQNDVDVVLPFPFICYKDTSSQYKRYVSKSDFIIFKQALAEINPAYIGIVNEILNGKYLYNYNMLLAKASVFDAYCAWMFPILEKMEDLCEAKGQKRNDRYIGYFGEILTAVYFLHNRNNLKIVHGRKLWMC